MTIQNIDEEQKNELKGVMADFSKNLQKAVIIAKKELDFYGKILKKKKMDNKLFKI